MAQLCTTVEQSLVLKVKGIDLETADMCWISIDGQPPSFVTLSYDQAKANRMTADSFLIDVAKNHSPNALTPAWSVEALYRLLPKIRRDEHSYLPFIYIRDGVGYCEYRNINIPLPIVIFKGKSLVEATFMMVFWCLENGYIEEGAAETP